MTYLIDNQKDTICLLNHCGIETINIVKIIIFEIGVMNYLYLYYDNQGRRNHISFYKIQ